MLFSDSDESQHIWLQRIQLHAYSLVCRSQQGTKSCWIHSGAAVFTPCRERERDVNIRQKMGHIIYRKAASSISLTAPTLHSMLRIDRLFIGLDRMLCKPGAVCQGRCWGKNSLQGKLVLVTLWASGMCWQVEEVCNCWRSPNPVSSKNIGLSQADPSDHPRVRFVTVWTAGVVFGHPTHQAGIANGRFIKGLRSAHCDWVQTLEKYI